MNINIVEFRSKLFENFKYNYKLNDFLNEPSCLSQLKKCTFYTKK